MKFGSVPVNEAVDGILAHTLKTETLTLKKGTRLTMAHLETLRQGGVADVIIARLDPDDVHEDEAASQIAASVLVDGLRQDPAFTGRANLFAERVGIFVPDEDRINQINAIDPAITFATRPAFSRVEAGRMVATIKIIPFAAPKQAVQAAQAVAGETDATLRVAPFVRKRVGVIATTLTSLKPSVLDKTRRILDQRLEGTGCAVSEELRIPHAERDLAVALAEIKDRCDLIVVFGASAIVDDGDVIPAAIEAAGGEIEAFGMPVDPGNLLLLASLDALPVLGAPGCARSPKENGFDWVLDRLLADVPVSRRDIQGMGVGGLLMEIVTRPQPRRSPAEPDLSTDRIGAVVLAAGHSRRMGDRNKLLLDVDGVPMVRTVVQSAIEANLEPVMVVTGHEADKVQAALADLNVDFVHNPNSEKGLSTSLTTGVMAIADAVDAAFVLLGDMPFAPSNLLRRMKDRLDPEEGRWIVVPRTEDGRQGNPVLFHHRFFDSMIQATGDRGARALISDNPDSTAFVFASEQEIFGDIDTPEEYAGYTHR